MTMNKKAKDLIRARMRWTGERYTTAREHVLRELAGAEASPAKDTSEVTPTWSVQALALSPEELDWGFTEREVVGPNWLTREARAIKICAVDLGPNLVAVKMSTGWYAILENGLSDRGRRGATSLGELTERFRLPPDGPTPRTWTLEGIDDLMTRTDRQSEVLVAEVDPDLGPYTRAIRVPKSLVEACCRAGYRRISDDEIDAMIGECEDFTADWKHSE